MDAPATMPGDETLRSPDATLIHRTLTEIAPVADRATSYFYALLFVRHPELRALFPAAMDTQRDRLLRAILTAADRMDNHDALAEYLGGLARGTANTAPCPRTIRRSARPS